MDKHLMVSSNVSKSVSLLISILVRYPELGTINYDPKNHILKFTFLIAKLISDSEYRLLEEKLSAGIEVYHQLRGSSDYVFKVKTTRFGRVTVVDIKRDVTTLSQEELSLMIEVLREQWGDVLVVDENDAVLEEELLIQEELIEEMLEDLKDGAQGKNLIAFREEGRVLVFNK